jgi:hypothetical protein
MSADATEVFLSSIALQVSLTVPTQDKIGIQRFPGRGSLRSEDAGDISGYDTRGIHHLLSRAFSQCISVSEVIDFDITDVISICNVHVAVDCSDGACFLCRTWSRRLSFGGASGRSDRRNVNMLDAFFGLDVGLDACCDSSYKILALNNLQ